MDIAPYIDHTLLKPEATAADIEKLCSEAKGAGFAAVCVPPYFVSISRKLLADSKVKIATVIGFPFGYSSTSVKLAEIDEAIEDGADEIDMVHNVAALRSGDFQYLEQEIARCVQAVHEKGKLLKLIVESGVLTREELLWCCSVYQKHNIDFMKTSTGYASSGANVEDVRLMRKQLPQSISIKASGGIRDFSFAARLIEAGATRIGCSASMTILEQSKQTIQN